MRRPLAVTFRSYREGDATGLVALLERAFGEWPRHPHPRAGEDYLRWKMASHALAPEATVVAEVDGETVACDLAIVNEAWLGDRAILATNDGDLAVDPAHQGRGVYSQLSYDRIQRAARFDLIFQDATPSAVRHVTERKGYRYLANEVEVFAWRTWWPRRLGRVERAAVGSRRPDARVSAIAANDPRLDRLFESAIGHFDFIRDRTARRLAWRHGDARGGDYALLGLVAGETLEGWVAVTVSAGHGAIVDALFAPGRESVAADLFSAAVNVIRRRGARRIRCWLPGRHRYRAALEAAGLRTTHRIVALQYMPKRLEEADVACLADRHAAIHVMLGDSDVV